MRIRSLLVVTLMAIIALLAACGGEDPDTTQSEGETATEASGEGVCAEGDATDLLAQVCEEGTIRVSTDPAYPPQSSLNEETGEYEGFDIDVATEIASRLGVDIEWETPAWDLITAGHWNDRWDMSVGSMTVTPDRAEVLHFSPAYY